MKSFLQNLFVSITVLTAMGIIGMACEPTFNAKEYAKDNHCPYEGLECPNALLSHINDSVAYASAEHVIDSLQAKIIQLETQLAGYEFKNHSKIISAGITRIIRDERGLLSVEFKRGNKEYAFDYITDAEFQNEFGFAVK